MVYCNITTMTYKTKETGIPKMAKAVERLVTVKHPDERVLVHAHSYHLARAIADTLDPMRTILYTESSARDEALERFRQSDNGILVAASMDRGVDLKYDQCRVQVIAKVPYPNVGDRQVSARMHSPGGQQWYNVQMVRSILQMCGRVVRAADDYGITYILDGAFGKVWNEQRALLPGWWRESVKMVGSEERLYG